MGIWDMPARRVVTDTELRFNPRHDEKDVFAVDCKGTFFMSERR